MNSERKKIGIVYHDDYLLHTYRGHAECSERLLKIMDALKTKEIEGLVEHFAPQPAALEDIMLVHDRAYIESIEEACRSGRAFLDMDTYIVPESYRVALLSAGGALTGLCRVMSGEFPATFVLNRPPGHHAERNRAMGFCLFNNVAVAARAARRDYNLERVAIVDWDVHHGNGTQHAFEDDRGVLFISTHQSPAYPGTGGVGEVGRGEGKGYTVNIPLPVGCGDADYAIFFEKVIGPVLEQYAPQLLIVSAGQDAYRKDPLAGMALTLGGYFMMAKALSEVAAGNCGGKILLCLEGGYHLEGQAGAIVQVLNALGGWGLPVGEKGPLQEPSREALRRLEEVLFVQRRYWDLGDA